MSNPYTRLKIWAGITFAVTLVLYLVGLTKGWWGIAIVVGGTLVAALLAANKTPNRHMPQSDQNAREIKRALARTASLARRKTPHDIARLVQSIKTLIMDILPRIDHFDTSNQDIFNLKQTAVSYLPEVIENYVSIPRISADNDVIRDGKTATDIVVEQLKLLEKEMLSLQEDIDPNDVQRLLIHGRFLKDKFNDSDILN